MSKRRWKCETVERTFTEVSDTEMRQRLAEILELLLTHPCQLQRVPAFSKDLNSLERDSRLIHKRKDTA